jgi:hypothetical protein
MLMFQNKSKAVTVTDATVGTTKCHLTKMAVQYIIHPKT